MQTHVGKHSQKQDCGTIPSAPGDANAVVWYPTPTIASVVSAVNPGKLIVDLLSVTQNVVYLPLSVLTMHAGTDGDPSEAPRRAGPRTLAATEGLCAAASNIRPITPNGVVKLLGESGGFFV